MRHQASTPPVSLIFNAISPQHPDDGEIANPTVLRGCEASYPISNDDLTGIVDPKQIWRVDQLLYEAQALLAEAVSQKREYDELILDYQTKSNRIADFLRLYDVKTNEAKTEGTRDRDIQSREDKDNEDRLDSSNLCRAITNGYMDKHKISKDDQPFASMNIQDLQLGLAAKIAQRHVNDETNRTNYSSDTETYRQLYINAFVLNEVAQYSQWICPGSPANTSEQLDDVGSRFKLTVTQAYARVAVAAVGLVSVYNPPPPRPSAPLTNIQKLFPPAPVIDLRVPPALNLQANLMYVDQAINYVSGFTSKDVSYVLPVSVRAYLEKQGTTWNSAGAVKNWNITIDQSVFPGLTSVRLKGLSAFVEYSGNPSPQPLFTVTISAPQNGCPPIVIGRSTRRDTAFTPDIAGSNTLDNSTPLGTWKLAVNPVYASSGLKIDDVVIDLYVSAQPSS